MDTEKDIWFWLAVFVSIVAALVWAFASITVVDSTCFAWGAVVVTALAGGGVAVRAGLKAKGVVWTEEQKEAQRRRAWQQLWESLPLVFFLLGSMLLQRLVSNSILPGWADVI